MLETESHCAVGANAKSRLDHDFELETNITFALEPELTQPFATVTSPTTEAPALRRKTAPARPFTNEGLEREVPARDCRLWDRPLPKRMKIE